MMKSPNVNTLGAHNDVLNPYGEGNGHIPRNVRLCWVLADAVEPYVDVMNDDDLPSQIAEVGGLMLLFCAYFGRCSLWSAIT